MLKITSIVFAALTGNNADSQGSTFLPLSGLSLSGTLTAGWVGKRRGGLGRMWIVR